MFISWEEKRILEDTVSDLKRQLRSERVERKALEKQVKALVEHLGIRFVYQMPQDAHYICQTKPKVQSHGEEQNEANRP